MSISVFDFVSLRVCEPVGLWICEFVGLGVYGSTNLWVDEFISLWVCGLASLRVWEFVSLRVCGSASLWIDEFISLWVCRVVSLWACELVDLMSLWACGLSRISFNISKWHIPPLIGRMLDVEDMENRNPDWPLANRGSYRFALQCKIILLREPLLPRRWAFAQQPRQRVPLLRRVFQPRRFRQQP